MNELLTSLHLKAKNLPPEPGVYLMKNSKHEVIYVGKAKNLPNRVKTYFNPKYPKNIKTNNMVAEVKDFDFLVVTNEVEALRLEFNLIKQHKPKYNIKLKNTSGYPYLKVDLNNPYPKLEVTYTAPVKNKVRYFGPYPNIRQLYETRDFLNQRLQLRTCSDHELKNRSRPCLLYQLKQCSAPCAMGDEKYAQSINLLLKILEGNRNGIKELKKQMDEYANAEQFEQAAKMRDLIEFAQQQQTTVSQQSKKKQIYISWSEQNTSIFVGCLTIDEGKVVGMFKFVLENFEGTKSCDLIEENLWSMLSTINFPVQELILKFKPHDYIKEVLESEMQLKVKEQNKPEYEELILKNLHQQQGMTHEQLEQMKSELNLSKIPYKIECMDISNWQESHPVGSKVVMMEGILDKASYRKFKMKTKGPNDFAMIKELVTRRFGHEEDSFPDLLVIDGGLQQVLKAQEALEELKIQGVELVGLAKDKAKSDFKSEEIIRTGERIVKPTGEQILITSSMQAFKITKLRDEAHRFAITFHRQLRSKNSLISGIKEERELKPKKDN